MFIYVEKYKIQVLNKFSIEKFKKLLTKQPESVQKRF